MRYSPSEKFEIIELVQQSSLSIPRTLAPIGIPRSTFYDWYSRYQEGGIEALLDDKPRPRRIWNKIPDKIETAIVNLALEEPDLSPRELAVNFTEHEGQLCVRSHRLSALEGPWPDHEPGLHPDEGGRFASPIRRPPQTSFGRPTSRI